MRGWVVATAIMMSAVMLAGCADEGSDDVQVEDVDPDTFQLAAGKGALQGLVLDDRFRPIADAFVLLQPAGITTDANGDGEFTFVDLEPGKYTIRVQAEGHEAVPQTVTVVEGVFEEVQVVARRVLSAGGTILTQEFSVFIPCGVNFVAGGTNADCTADLSGDSERSSFSADYSEYGANVTYMVTEMLASQQGFYEVRVRPPGVSGGNDNYAVNEVKEGDYLKMVNQRGVVNEVDQITGTNAPWENDGSFNTILFVDGALKGETPANCCGIGPYFGVKAQFVQSVFIGEPEVALDTYCALC